MTRPLPTDAPGDLRASRAPLAGFVAMGGIWGTLAAMLPELRAAVGASDAALGVAFFFSACVGVATMLAAPRLGRWLGPQAPAIATAAMVASVLLPGQATQLWQLALALALMGATSGLADVLLNGRVAAIEASRGRPLMNLNHAAYSLSFFAAAVATGLARDLGAGAAGVFGVLALGLAPLVLVTLERPAPAAAVGAAGPEATGAGSGATVWTLVALGGGVILLASVLEASGETWSAMHLERTLGAGPALGGLGPAVLGLCMGLGRLAGQGLSRRVPPQRLMRGGALLATAGAVAAALAPDPLTALAGIAALGLGGSVLMPTALTLIGASAPADLRTVVIARAYALGFIGYVTGPASMGLIAEGAGLRWSFFALGVVAALTLALLPALARRARV